jgi:hypothetical protein
MADDNRLLLVLLNGNYHLVVVIYGIIDTLCRILMGFDLTEKFLDFLLQQIPSRR